MTRYILLLCIALIASSSNYSTAQTARVVFLATVTGDGSDATPFRPSGWGTVSNMRCIDIRKDATVTTGRMLCGADSLPGVAGVNQIGDAIGERMTAPRKAVLEAALGVTITASNVIDIIAELLINHGRNDGTRWKPLLPDRDGKYKIYLGSSTPDFQQTAWLYPYVLDNGLVADASNALLHVVEPALAWAASFTENWTCADNASLTCTLTWTEVIGSAGAIVSNQASFTGTGGSTLARAESDTATVDHTVDYTLVSIDKGSGADASMAVLGRVDSTVATTYYACESLQDAGPNHLLYKRVSGARTDLVDDPTDPANGDTVLLRMSGSSISCDRNGSAFISPVTDTGITTGTRGGVRYNGSHATSSAVVDAFTIADISSSTKKRAPIFFQ